MSIHKSLKSGNALQRHRNVLTRVERLDKLEEEKRWTEEDSVIGIPKVRSMKIVAKKKKKKDEVAEGADAPAEAAPAEAAEA
ncbi:MAG: small basic protein [Planctomycetota bacterium]|jgi:small basic protein (TIGR04137 family)